MEGLSAEIVAKYEKFPIFLREILKGFIVATNYFLLLYV
jgi:hypothetical protein